MFSTEIHKSRFYKFLHESTKALTRSLSETMNLLSKKNQFDNNANNLKSKKKHKKTRRQRKNDASKKQSNLNEDKSYNKFRKKSSQFEDAEEY